MSDFIQIYRDLFLHPSVISSPPSYRCVLFTILAHACYAPCQQDDHGKLIDLKPGQLMCTIRGLADLANVGRKDVEHALARFTQIKILGQEVGHRKTILTVLWGLKLNSNGTRSGTTLGQVRDIKEEGKKERIKESPPSDEIQKGKEEVKGKLSKKSIQFAKAARQEGLPFSEVVLAELWEKHPQATVNICLEFHKRKPQQKNLDLPDIWLKKHVIKQHEFLEIKKEYEE